MPHHKKLLENILQAVKTFIEENDRPPCSLGGGNSDHHFLYRAIDQITKRKSWMVRLQEIGAFIEENGRSPRSFGREKSDHRFLYRAIDQYKKGELLPNMVETFEEFVRKYPQHSKITKHKSWEVRLQEVGSFIEENGRPPCSLGGERVDYHFLYRARDQYKKGELLPNMVETFEEFVRKYSKYFS